MSFFLRRFIFIKHTKKQGGYIMRENIKTGIKYLALFGMCFLGGRSLAAGQTVRVDGEKPCRLAILIDDFGYCGAGTEEMLALSIPFTAAVMPFSPARRRMRSECGGRQGNFYPHADGIPHGQAGMGRREGGFSGYGRCRHSGARGGSIFGSSGCGRHE